MTELFSFKGSLDRKTFLKYTIGVFIVFALLYFLFGVAMTTTLGFTTPGGVIFGVIFAWFWLALFIKRGRALGVWWWVSVLLSLLFAPITWVAYLILGKK